MFASPPGDSRILPPVTDPSSPHADRGELDTLVHTVRLEELLMVLRRHVWLVLGVVAAVLVAIGYLAVAAAPVFRGVAVIRLSDPRRALTSGVVDGPSSGADGGSADPLLSQVTLLTSRTVAGAVVDSMPILRMRTRNFKSDVLADVTMPVGTAPDSFRIGFGQDSFVVRVAIRSVEHLEDILHRLAPHDGDTITSVILNSPVSHRVITREVAAGS